MYLTTDIQLASFDLDNTLTIDGKCSKANKEALIRLHNAGCKIVINTGRSFCLVDAELQEDYVDYIITSNGSKIYDNHTKKLIYTQFVEVEDRQKFYSDLIQLPCLKIICDDKTYTTKKNLLLFLLANARSRANYNFSIRGSRKFISSMDTTHNLKEIILNRRDILKIEFRGSNRTKMEKDIEYLNQTYPLYAVNTQDLNVEVCSIHASKGKTLLYLANQLGIPQKAIAAFGDSGNDIDALHAAGIAIAMENATEPIKEAADIIIGHVKQDGIAHYINSLFKE